MGGPGPGRDGLRSAVALLVAVVALTVAGTASAAVAGDRDSPVLVSRGSGEDGAKANGPSYRPMISARGRYVVFESRATNLVPEDTDELIDVYVRDLATGETTLVSRASGPAGAKGDSDSADPSITADGRMVAFASTSSNLEPGTPTTTAFHVYVRDLVNETTIRVDRASGPDGELADNEAGHPDISAGGRHVAFDTAASNLDPADADPAVDVYIRDLAAETTTLVSHRSPDVAGKDLGLPAVSADGGRVAYRTGPAVEGGRLFARDTVAGTTAAFGAADNVLGSPSISADGRRVALTTKSTQTAPRGDQIRVWEPAGGRKTTASRDLAPWGGYEAGSSSDPSLSADGRYVTFAVQHGDRKAGFRVGAVIRDLRKGTSTNVRQAVSRRSTDSPPFLPLFPTLSRGAKRLAFLSQARRPAAGDPDGLPDVFVTAQP